MISKYITQLIISNSKIAIAFSVGRQLNISKHISTTSCDLVLKIFLNVLLMTWLIEL